MSPEGNDPPVIFTPGQVYTFVLAIRDTYEKRMRIIAWSGAFLAVLAFIAGILIG